MNPTTAPPLGSSIYPLNDVVERLYTIADVAALPTDLPSGSVRYELDNGRLISMAPCGGSHGSVEARFTFKFILDGEERGLGKAWCGEVGIILSRNPDSLVGADAAFVTNASLPVRESPEGYLETIPELILEVMSKNDSWAAVERKIAAYFRAGVRVVWVADPAKKTVTVCRPGQPSHVLTENDTLTVEDVIPGFQMLVGKAFA